MIKKGLILILLLTAGLLLSCDDSGEDNSVYSFEVSAVGGGFTGFYRVDGGDIVTFEDEFNDSKYTYKISLDSPATVFIRADADDDPAETNSLEIIIYKNDVQINFESELKDDDEHLGISLYHDFEDNETEEE